MSNIFKDSLNDYEIALVKWLARVWVNKPFTYTDASGASMAMNIDSSFAQVLKGDDWSSPPCTSHSRLRNALPITVYPNMTLYQEIILLKKWFKGQYVVENVIPYYASLITPSFVMARHFFGVISL